MNIRVKGYEANIQNYSFIPFDNELERILGVFNNFIVVEINIYEPI